MKKMRNVNKILIRKTGREETTWETYAYMGGY
jgi:hypothetical protein